MEDRRVPDARQPGPGKVPGRPRDLAPGARFRPRAFRGGRVARNVDGNGAMRSPRRARALPFAVVLALLPWGATGCSAIQRALTALAGATRNAVGNASSALPTPPPRAIVPKVAANPDPTRLSPTPTGPVASPPARSGIDPEDVTRSTETRGCGSDVGLVGDSITRSAHYPRKLKGLCAGTRFTNAPDHYSFIGKRTDQMRDDLPRVLAAKHDTVIILGGVNNIYQGAAIQGHLAAMYRRARAAGARVVAVTVMPYKGYPSWRAEYGRNIRELNTWIRAQAGKDVDVVVDAFAAFSDPADPDAMKRELTGDRLHPNQAGYDVLARAVFDALNR